MSRTHKKIASFILDHGERVGLMSIQTLGEKAGVSSASIVRFSRSLGYSGFDEFKRDIHSDIRQILSPGEKVALKELHTIPARNRLQKLFDNEVENLKTTLNHLDIHNIEYMAEGLLHASRIFVGGFGVSTHVMRIFEYSLMNILRKDVHVLAGSISDFNPLLFTARSDDVFCLLTLPPYSPEIVFVAESAKACGSSLYLFTDSACCPVYELADRVIRCRNNSLVSFNSYVGTVAVLQILTNLILLGDKDASVERIKRMNKMVETEKNGYKKLAVCREVKDI